MILSLRNLSWCGLVDVYGTVCWFCWAKVASPRFSLHSAVNTTVEVAEEAVETVFAVVPFQNFLMIGWTFVTIKRMPFLGPKSQPVLAPGAVSIVWLLEAEKTDKFKKITEKLYFLNIGHSS